MNIKQAREFAFGRLTSESASIDCDYLLTFLLNKNFTWLKTWPEYQLTAEQERGYKQLIERRAKGEPIAYITGEQGFWTLRLNTTPATLIPRPETELLVEKALEFLAERSSAKVLDLGTGTGAIALSIASERSEDDVLGSDFSLDAVMLAKTNAIKNQIKNVEFIQSDWFKQIAQQTFDLIVANPPYVAEGDPHLVQGDLVFEPKSALVASGDGLDDIRLIVSQAFDYLSADGGLMVEHGFQQGDAVREIFTRAGFQKVKVIQDLSRLDRLTMGVKGKT